MCILKYTYILTFVQHVCTHAHTRKNMHSCIFICMHIYTHLHVYIYTPEYIYIHIYEYIYICTRARTHTHIYIHIWNHICAVSRCQGGLYQTWKSLDGGGESARERRGGTRGFYARHFEISPNRWYAWLSPLKCVTFLIPVCDMTYSYARNDSIICNVLQYLQRVAVLLQCVAGCGAHSQSIYQICLFCTCVTWLSIQASYVIYETTHHVRSKHAKRTRALQTAQPCVTCLIIYVCSVHVLCTQSGVRHSTAHSPFMRGMPHRVQLIMPCAFYARKEDLHAALHTAYSCVTPHLIIHILCTQRGVWDSTAHSHVWHASSFASFWKKYVYSYTHHLWNDSFNTVYAHSFFFCCGYWATSQGLLDLFEVDLSARPAFSFRVICVLSILIVYFIDVLSTMYAKRSGVATIIRLLTIIGLFCRISSLL